MSKKVFLSFFILLAVTMMVLFSGCTTAQSRRRDQRLEELERRVAKIEFENSDGSTPNDDLSKYRDMARSAR